MLLLTRYYLARRMPTKRRFNLWADEASIVMKTVFIHTQRIRKWAI
jgi:hypothetical protein